MLINILIDGEIDCTYYSDNTIKQIRNNLVTYEKTKDVTIKSEREAYEELQDGKFRYYSGDNIGEIIIDGVTLDYVMDTKGFYQPVYSFSSKIDGNEILITIPAIDSWF